MSKGLQFDIALDIYSKITDGTHDSPKQQATGKPLITSKHIKGRNIDFATAYLISEEDYNKINERSQVEQWDVVVSMIGEYCGYCYVERSSKIDYVVKNVGLYKAGSKLEAEWLYYYLTSPIGKGYLNAIKLGSSQPYLTLGGLRNLPILKPQNSRSKETIVKILSNLDSKIELNNKINAELEAMAKLIYDYWFVQFDFPNAKGKPYKSSGGKMVWSDELKREIPEGWEVKMLFDGMDVQYGFPFSTSKFTEKITNIPVIRIRDILENTISIYTTEEVDDKYRLLRNDLLIGMDGNFHLNFWDKNGAYLNQRSVRIRSKVNSNVSNFQAYFELQPHIKAREKNVSRTTVGHLSDKDLKRLFVLNAKQTEEFNPRKTFDSFLDKITTNRIENQKLSELRDWLLPMLMNGQVQIKDAVVTRGNTQSVKEIAIKPANTYFYQTQVVAAIINASKQNKIRHGEMTLAKYSYLLDKVYKVPTLFNYDRWHLGPYPKEMKKVVNNKKFFKIQNNEISVVPQKKEYDFQFQRQVEDAIKELASIFNQYKGKERSHQTELLATVCKVVEDIQSTDLKAVRESMEKWPIELKGEKFKNKAEKFGEEETQSCLKILSNKNWQSLLIAPTL